MARDPRLERLALGLGAGNQGRRVLPPEVPRHATPVDRMVLAVAATGRHARALAYQLAPPGLDFPQLRRRPPVGTTPQRLQLAPGQQDIHEVALAPDACGPLQLIAVVALDAEIVLP